MKRDTFYTQWKETRRHVSVPEHFAVGLMARIENQVSGQDDEMPAGMTLLTGRLMQWSAAGGLVLLGLFRIFYIVASLLRPHLLMPY